MFGLFAFFFLRALNPELPAILALVNVFAPFLFAPLLLSLLLALFWRSKLVLLGTLAGLALFAVLYLPLFLPRLHAAPEPANGRVRVMTFNLGPGQSQPEQVSAAIANENADIVAVQELVPETAALLRARLQKRYPYTVLNLNTSNTGVLSRYPITKGEWFRAAGMGRYDLHLALAANGTVLHLLAIHGSTPDIAWSRKTHLPVGLDDKDSQRQAADIADRAKGLGGRVLVAGDFNMSDQSPGYAYLADVLHDTYREAGWGLGFTFPNGLKVVGVTLPWPVVRLDYIFHSADLYPEQIEVKCEGGSDHCYLVAQFVLGTVKTQ
jgi:endonuclease/exonuclease/phosphatase (EEP) superfamily protein YafD